MTIFSPNPFSPPVEFVQEEGLPSINRPTERRRTQSCSAEIVRDLTDDKVRSLAASVTPVSPELLGTVLNHILDQGHHGVLEGLSDSPHFEQMFGEALYSAAEAGDIDGFMKLLNHSYFREVDVGYLQEAYGVALGKNRQIAEALEDSGRYGEIMGGTVAAAAAAILDVVVAVDLDDVDFHAISPAPSLSDDDNAELSSIESTSHTDSGNATSDEEIDDLFI